MDHCQHLSLFIFHKHVGIHIEIVASFLWNLDSTDSGVSSSGSGAIPRRGSASATSLQISGNTSSSNSTSRDHQAGTSKLNGEGLPSGWTMQVAPNGRVFFINHAGENRCALCGFYLKGGGSGSKNLERGCKSLLTFPVFPRGDTPPPRAHPCRWAKQ